MRGGQVVDLYTVCACEMFESTLKKKFAPTVKKQNRMFRVFRSVFQVFRGRGRSGRVQKPVFMPWNRFFIIKSSFENPPRPLASGRVDVWLCALCLPSHSLCLQPTATKGRGTLPFPSLLAPARPVVGGSELLYLSRGPSLDTQIEFKTRPRRFKTF